MGFFKNAATEWEKIMTENDLDQMKAQGLDVSAYREKLVARRAKEQAEAERDLQLFYNPIDLSKLEPYFATPRSMETPFFKALAGKAPWFGKEKWRKKHTEGEIIYVGVVDAPKELWKGGKHEADSHQFIGVYALDEAHKRNVEWLKRVTTALREMCEGKRHVAADCQTVVEQTRDENNWKTERLGASLAEGAEAYTRKLVIFDKELPKGYLPTDGIVPHFWYDGTIQRIPGEFYKG